MAKPPKKKKPEPEALDDDAQELAARARSSKKLLIAAALMSAMSLGGGFYLARAAFIQDASSYEVDYVEENGVEEDGHGAQAKDDDHGGDAYAKDTKTSDPAAKDGHSAEEDPAQKGEKGDDGHGKEGKALADTGLWDFGDILTNINGYDAQGAPTKAFLKLSLIMVYQTEPGAADKVAAREPFMRDLFNGYLRGINERDVRGMAGVLHLKAELLKRARAAMGNDLPREILINDLIVQ